MPRDRTVRTAKRGCSTASETAGLHDDEIVLWQCDFISSLTALQHAGTGHFLWNAVQRAHSLTYRPPPLCTDTFSTHLAARDGEPNIAASVGAIPGSVVRDCPLAPDCTITALLGQRPPRPLKIPWTKLAFACDAPTWSRWQGRRGWMNNPCLDYLTYGIPLCPQRRCGYGGAIEPL